MGHRLLCIDAELLVGICHSLRDGPLRYFRVVRDPIPADAKIVSVNSFSRGPCHPTEVRILLESPEWESAPPGTKIKPWLEVVVPDCPQPAAFPEVAVQIG